MKPTVLVLLEDAIIGIIALTVLFFWMIDPSSLDSLIHTIIR